MIDVLLIQSPHGGADVEYRSGGRVVLTSGPETAVRLSIDGGNDQDLNVTSTERDQWWGNLARPGRAYRCTAQGVAVASPLTQIALNRYQDAVVSDLSHLVARGVVRSISPEISVKGKNGLQLVVTTPSGVVTYKRFLK